MNEMKLFESAQFGGIRVIDRDGEPWFVGKDVAEALGYKDTSDALKRHVDEEDKLTRCFTDSGQNREMFIINESGLYSLVLSSKLQSAKQFKRWVTSKILPAIRKHGGFLTREKVEEVLLSPDTIIRLATDLKTEREQRIALENTVATQKPKVIFADSVVASDTSILVGDLAKILRQNGIEMGQRRLFEWFRTNGWLMRQECESKNMPTQRGMERGFFEIKETAITLPNGHISVTKTPKITGAGQVFFLNAFMTGAEV